MIYVHKDFNEILGKKKNHRGKTTWLVFSIAHFEDMEDNWLQHRNKYIKRGPNKGKLKSWVNLGEYSARVGNSGGCIKHKYIDPIFDKGILYAMYSLRKALMPSTFSKMIYYLWKTKHFDFIKQLKNRCIKEFDLIDTVSDVFSKLHKADLNQIGFSYYHLKKNVARWENDVDGPKDYEVFKEKMEGKKESENLVDSTSVHGAVDAV